MVHYLCSELLIISKMSPRIKKIRKVSSPPAIKGLKPYGGLQTNVKLEAVSLHFEEYEALRLCDYDIFNHHQASVMMGVSRPTFTRIYAMARQKIALAIVEGRQISIEGGKVYFDSDWYHCRECSCFFNHPDKESKIENCPLCGSTLIESYDLDMDDSVSGSPLSEEVMGPRFFRNRNRGRRI
jgi:uncharacterized protein